MAVTLRRGRDRRGTLRVAFGRTLWIGRAGRIAGAWPVTLAWRRTEAIAIAIARRRPSTGDGHVTHEPLRCCRSSAITHGSISQGALGCGAHGGLGHGGLHHLGSLSHLNSRILLLCQMLTDCAQNPPEDRWIRQHSRQERWGLADRCLRDWSHRHRLGSHRHRLGSHRHRLGSHRHRLRSHRHRLGSHAIGWGAIAVG